jgi:ribonuclease P protein component
MLPAAHRMRSSSQFTRTTRQGVKVSRGSVVAYVDRTEDPVPARVGLIVSKAIGNSVARHRAARRLRGAVHPLLAEFPSGLHVVLRALPGADADPCLPAQVADAVRVGLSREAAGA